MLDIKAVIFDIDDTLTSERSWVKIVEGVGASMEEELKVYHAAKEGMITPDEANQKVYEIWTRNGPVSKKQFEEIFQAIPLREGAMDLVEYLKNKNIVVCLITGSIDVYAEIVGQRLGIENYFANASLAWDDQGNVQKLIWHNNEGALKLEQFRKFIKAKGLKPEECAVVGDSENDHLLFLETKNGIAIRTPAEDKTLESIAWKVVNNLSEIKNII